MSLKRECDRCKEQQDHNRAKMVTIELPYVPETPILCVRILDVCYACARAIHKAAEPIPQERHS